MTAHYASSSSAAFCAAVFASFLSGLSAEVRRIPTGLETPKSSMVTPYMTSARAMVRLLWVTRCIGGDVDGLDLLVLDHLLTGRVGLLGSHSLGQLGTTVWVEIGGRDHLHIRVVLVKKGSSKLAQTKAGNTDLDFAI